MVLQARSMREYKYYEFTITKRGSDKILSKRSIKSNEDIRYEVELKIPPKSIGDTVHLAVTCLNNIDYLVTWNCAHICNGEIIKKLTKLNKQLDVHMPIICIPEQLMEGE